jgi:glycosyltransferase involved in cell wall biosynthesis
MRAKHVAIVQPFISPATFFGLVAALVVGSPAIIVTERCGVRRFRGIGYKTYRALEDRLTHVADAVVPNSLAGHADLIRRGIPPERIHVINNGVNRRRLQVDPARVAAHRARLGGPPDGHILGILAGLTPAKDHSTFLRAAADVSARFPGTRCAIVGDGPLRADLETLARSLNMTDRVVFYGYAAQVADILAACDLLVSSSRDNEGHSNSILEAMALNVPVVATNVGGNRELVEDGVTGYLVPIGDKTALAAAIERALIQPDATRAMAARARAMVDTRFGVERMVADYEALYAAVLGASRRRAPLQFGEVPRVATRPRV